MITQHNATIVRLLQYKPSDSEYLIPPQDKTKKDIDHLIMIVVAIVTET